MLDSFTSGARRCVMLAHESARDLRYDSLDTGCLLLGLLGEETGISAKALADQGITVDAVRAQITAQRSPELKEPWLINRLRRGNVSSFVDIPPEFRALLVKWGITDLTLLINHSSPNADATTRAGRKAWLVLSHGVFHNPQTGRFVLAHELGHLVRNDSHRGRVGGYLLRMLIPAALFSFTPAAWAIIAASFLLHWLAIRWPAEIACDRIAARLTSYPEMVSALDLRAWRRYVPLPSHPPAALRLALGRSPAA